MRLIIVTRQIDGKRMYINADQVCAVFPDYRDKSKTVIQFPGGEENYLLVSESVDSVANMLDS